MSRCSELASARATREVLGRFGLDAKHALGQNFLVDDHVVARTLELAEVEDGSTVLEVGPGIGTLTVALLRQANVVAVERDADLVPVLAATTASGRMRFALVEGDALKTTQADIEAACARIAAPRPRMLVANLPYAIAATVILDWFSRFDFIDSMTVMVQSEVADRIMADPGTKAYGAYTVKLRLHARAVGRFGVAPSCFYPAPRVDSAVIRLERQTPDADARLVGTACALADAAFAQRRKTIRNSMKSAYEADVVDGLLAACGIDPAVRGETLEPQDYLEMARALRA